MKFDTWKLDEETYMECYPKLDKMREKQGWDNITESQ